MINAYEYGRALFMLSEEEKITEEIAHQIKSILDVLTENPEFCNVLDTPAIPSDEKPKIIERAFGCSHVYVSNFIKILCSKRAISQFGECVKAFFEAYDEARNIMRATAVTALPMKDGQIRALCAKLEKITGKTVEVSNVIDPDLIGGVTLRYEGKQFDGSIKSRLDELKKRLSETIV